MKYTLTQADLVEAAKQWLEAKHGARRESLDQMTAKFRRQQRVGGETFEIQFLDPDPGSGHVIPFQRERSGPIRSVVDDAGGDVQLSERR